jgi:Raf kinase inhibitor-like YbhB/YbcL family protein
MRTIFAAIMIFSLSMLSMSTGYSEEEGMKNLEVNLGFSEIPEDHTCEGENISPRIEIQGLDAASMAIIVDDPDSSSGNFTHWAIWNIEPIGVVPEGIPRNATVNRPIKARQGTNNFGQIGYLGPCPPPGKPHRYVFHVYGLDRMLDLRPGASRRELDAAMKGHIVQQGEAIARYGR